jgi:rhodanese-related sulfurtransferase
MNRLHVQDLIPFTQAHAGVVLLDVREPWEVALAPLSVDGARTMSMPMGEVPARCSELDPSSLSSVFAITGCAARRSSHS